MTEDSDPDKKGDPVYVSHLLIETMLKGLKGERVQGESVIEGKRSARIELSFIRRYASIRAYFDAARSTARISQHIFRNETKELGGTKSSKADGSRPTPCAGVSQPFSTWSTTMTPSRLSGSREQRPRMLLSTSSLSRELV
jgi:hypothetical protein